MEQVQKAWAILGVGATRAVDWLNIDLSAPTLAKYAILLVTVWGLLWALGRVYRGEIQNQSIEADIIDNIRAGYYTPRDVLFTKNTMDIKTATLSASLDVSFMFALKVGERTLQRKTRVQSGHFKLRMQRASSTLGDNQFAFDKGIAGSIRAAAEARSTRLAQKFDRRWTRRIARAFGQKTAPVAVLPGHYELKVRFRSDFIRGPAFILFDHPDSEVKATGWLTLLTSLFAILAQLLFQGPLRSASADRVHPQSDARPPIVTRAP